MMKLKGSLPAKQIKPAPPPAARFRQQQLVVGGILFVALLAFELFNFDTTRFALRNLLGDVYFWRIHWATILAIAFCAIDFAGLARLFTPQQEQETETPREVWYLMGAWLMGATMNAVMTWWAVSLTLLTHDLGNEVLSREQLVRWVPFFIAALVWLTRILFIGALSIAGDYMLARPGTAVSTADAAVTSLPAGQPRRAVRPAAAAAAGHPHNAPANRRRQTPTSPARPATPNQRRPPAPATRPVRGTRPAPAGMQAQSRRRP